MAIGLQPVVVLKSSIEVVFGLVVGNRHLLEGSHYRIRPTLDRNQPIPRHFRPVLRRNRLPIVAVRMLLSESQGGLFVLIRPI